MRYKILLLFATTVLLSIISKSTSWAQDDTFGPVCEEGITCTPTQPAQPTATPSLPVTGPMETTFALAGLGGILFLAGTTSWLTFHLTQRQSF